MHRQKDLKPGDVSTFSCLLNSGGPRRRVMMRRRVAGDMRVHARTAVMIVVVGVQVRVEERRR